MYIYKKKYLKYKMKYLNMKKSGGKEVEYQFPKYNKKQIIKIIKNNKGKQIHKKMMYKAVYYFTKDNKTLYRIRQENDGITATKKDMYDDKPADEYEIKVVKGSSFDEIHDFIRNMVPNIKDTKQILTEKYREKWSLPIKGVHEIVFDIWPGLDEYLEIDCSNKETLDKVIKLFGLQDSKYYTKGHSEYYKEKYGIEKKDLLGGKIKFTFKDFKI